MRLFISQVSTFSDYELLRNKTGLLQTFIQPYGVHNG